MIQPQYGWAEVLDQWQLKTQLPPGDSLRISCGNGMFVAVGEAIFTSPDGAAWTERASRTNHRFFGVAYGSAVYAALADNGAILTSADGSEWTPRDSGTHLTLFAIAYPLHFPRGKSDPIPSDGQRGGCRMAPDSKIRKPGDKQIPIPKLRLEGGVAHGHPLLVDGADLPLVFSFHGLYHKGLAGHSSCPLKFDYHSFSDR